MRIRTGVAQGACLVFAAFTWTDKLHIPKLFVVLSLRATFPFQYPEGVTNDRLSGQASHARDFTGEKP
jgi:hypothetical protein